MGIREILRRILRRLTDQNNLRLRPRLLIANLFSKGTFLFLDLVRIFRWTRSPILCNRFSLLPLIRYIIAPMYLCLNPFHGLLVFCYLPISNSCGRCTSGSLRCSLYSSLLRSYRCPLPLYCSKL